jgi:hypothetical protein
VAIPWTPDNESRLLLHLERGRTYGQIAALMGTTPVAIERRCGLLKRRYGNLSTTLSVRRVAQIMGVHPPTVMDWARYGWIVVGPQASVNHKPRPISREDFDAFLANRAGWHAWTPERITDPVLRDHARDLRRGVRFLTPDEVGERFGYHPKYITALLRLGRMPGRRFGMQWSVLESDLETWTPPPARRSTQPLTDQERARIRALAKKGRSREEIALLMGGCSTSTVGRVLSRVA